MSPRATAPATWPAIAADLARHAAGLTPAEDARHVRVGIDGAPAAKPRDLAEAIALELRPLGREAIVVPAEGFLKPASLRFEHGKRDADAFLDLWLDSGAMFREVFDPLEAKGSGRILPDLWDPVRDRATRSPYVELAAGTVVIVVGTMILNRWFPFDLSVHIHLSAGALRRKTDESAQWTLPAFARYDEETDPLNTADVAVRADHADRPAWSRLPR
ncbi:uridine kinase [Phytomonospora sp. NPDC050363]|uniref:uridine kinase n=1 Tax=Phytomonospora sp. NPDC050363 TaxID=3155642 RepID=UPI0033CFDF78